LVLVLPACLAVSLVSVAYPMYVIRPFRHQGGEELAVALVITRFRPAMPVMRALAAALALIGYWRLQPRKSLRPFRSSSTIALVQ